MTDTQVKVKNHNVKIVANLFETDVPVIVLLSKKTGNGDQSFIACAIPDEVGEIDYYFAVFVGRTHLIRYFNEQCDLRFLFAFASGRKYFKIKHLAPSKNGTIQMEEFQGELSEKLLPEGRFFVTSHTSDYGIDDVASGEQRLLIDGHWDMQEFGSFYQKFSDLYSYEQAIDYIEEDEELKVKRVKRAFSSKPFKGGSSYIGFFGDLFDIIPVKDRPSLDGIEYHSPGHVDLRGKDEILESIKIAVSDFLLDAENIQSSHDALRGFMSKSKLLSITGDTRTVSADILKQLTALTTQFYSILPVGGKDNLKALTGSNAVVYAKVGLALFRRLKATAYFFAQGRLTYSD